jgi:hypothetical protein
MTSPKTEQRIADHSLEDFPALKRLRLDADEIAALSQQGSVATERRGQREISKLRFRRDGKQHVRYIGGADQAAIVQIEIAALQSGRRLGRELLRMSRTAKLALQASRAQLEPLLREEGLYFHGYTIRKRRRV